MSRPTFHPYKGETMALQLDSKHVYRGYSAPGAVCRIRIFDGVGGIPVVIASELDENNNTSITNLAEYVAAEVLLEYLSQRIGQDEPFIWIEHYSGEPLPKESHARRTSGGSQNRPAMGS
jgi:hypothetical protein